MLLAITSFLFLKDSIKPCTPYTGFGISKTRACNNCTPHLEIQRLKMSGKSHATHQLGLWWHSINIIQSVGCSASASNNVFDIKRNKRKVFYKICHFDQSILISWQWLVYSDYRFYYSGDSLHTKLPVADR